MAPTTSADRRYIADLAPSERVEGVFAIANTQLGRTRQDKPYLRCLVSDRTGELSGRMWSIDQALFNRLPTDGFAWIEGETQPYQGQLQLIIHMIDPVDPTPEQMRDLLPCSQHDPEEMLAEVSSLLDTLEHPAIRARRSAAPTMRRASSPSARPLSTRSSNMRGPRARCFRSIRHRDKSPTSPCRKARNWWARGRSPPATRCAGSSVIR